MSWPVLIGGSLALMSLILLLYWQFSLAEGAFLGRRVVVRLYDRFAPRYDGIKKFNKTDEEWFLGNPLAQALQSVATARVLDVASGTARLPLALFQQPTFSGHVVALDLSRQMLVHAAAKTTVYQDRLTLVWQDAIRLPFPDHVFDAVTCLEALEFLPDARATLAEMARVLRPGGIFLASNRIGPGARWFPGRIIKRQDLGALLESLSLEDVRINAWQVDYDIVWARKRSMGLASKPAHPVLAAPATLSALLCCPRCADGPLARQDSAWYCEHCQSHYPIAEDGVVEMAGKAVVTA